MAKHGVWSERDLATLLTVTSVMVIVSLAASAVPAMRATRVSPLAMIREEWGSSRIVGYFGIISGAKVFSRVPRPSISIWMVSPGWTGPTPAGVPVGIRSPGSRVMVAVM